MCYLDRTYRVLPTTSDRPLRGGAGDASGVEAESPDGGDQSNGAIVGKEGAWEGRARPGGSASLPPG